MSKIKDTILEIQTENEQLQAQIDFLQQENNRLLKEHRDLSDKTTFQARQINALKFRCGDYRRELDRVTSLSMFEFANEFCNDNELEEAGHALARSLGVGH
jgi:chromosome segregation ATPase